MYLKRFNRHIEPGQGDNFINARGENSILTIGVINYLDKD